ncbi:hypothetical protein D3273_19225, partial [Lichenibacterium minor]
MDKIVRNEKGSVIRNFDIMTSCQYLPTGWFEATGSEHGRPRCNDDLRGVKKADSFSGMSRGDLERLSKDELIELVLKLQRP